MDHKKRFMDLVQTLGQSHGTYEVFRDFLELAAIAMSNSADWSQREEREKRYMQIMKYYSGKEPSMFAEMLFELTEAMEVDTTDVLGEVFMELNLGNKWIGQVFTPMSICNLAGQISVTDLKGKLDSKGYVTVSEPACGGGAMIIGLANAMQEAGYNYQQQLLVTAVDVDIKAVHMVYIQLSLMGIPAVVIHGDTLLVKEYSRWKTPFYIAGGWFWKKNEAGLVVKLDAPPIAEAKDQQCEYKAS